LENPILRRSLGREAVDYLSKFQSELNQEFKQLGKPAEFSISIDYRLALVKKPGEGDVLLTAGPSGATTGVVEVPKDSGKTHPFRQKELVERVNEALNSRTQINRYDIQCVVKMFGIKKRPNFYYKASVEGSPHQYSKELVNWLVAEYEKDDRFFVKAREMARRT
jgi:hypothetical protein